LNSFVCATSKDSGKVVALRSYRSRREGNSRSFNRTKIWQACRATSAATTFFDPIRIGSSGQEFVDGAFGANNPVDILFEEARDLWGNEYELERKGKHMCVVSIGTGKLQSVPVHEDLKILKTLKTLATETEKTAERFHRANSWLDDNKRYYRFNVDSGLEQVGLEESGKRKDIEAATHAYIETQAVHKSILACVSNLADTTCECTCPCWGAPQGFSHSCIWLTKTNLRLVDVRTSRIFSAVSTNIQCRLSDQSSVGSETTLVAPLEDTKVSKLLRAHILNTG
jgi:hypothetical protein